MEGNGLQYDVDRHHNGSVNVLTITDLITACGRPSALAVAVVLFASPSILTALDLIPDIFKKEQVKSTVWELNEQYVRLVEIESDAELNDHPVVLDELELQQALASLQLWAEGGLSRGEEAVIVYPPKQAAQIAHYVVEALNEATTDEDVVFNVRGYNDVMLSLAKNLEWTTGRVFYQDKKLNLIIGEYRKTVDRGKKNVEGAFGIINDYSNMQFTQGSRRYKGKMPGRIVTTKGIQIPADGKLRPDWVRIDVAKAAEAYREAQTPAVVRKEELKARAEAAKLTIERRQMRKEMARMRKEIKNLQDLSQNGQSESLESRLESLQKIRAKGLITEEEFERRKEEILREL